LIALFRPTWHARIAPRLAEVLNSQSNHLPEFTQQQWYEVYHCACNELIAPALLNSIESKTATKNLPQDILVALSQIRDANRQRNKEAIADYQALCETLNAAQIKVTPLKGITRLQSNSPGIDRMIRDIDVLIHPNNLPLAMRALRDADYLQAINRYHPSYYTKKSLWQTIELDDYRNSMTHSLHHVPVLIRSPTSHGVDLHTRLNLFDNAFTTYLEKQLLGDDSIEAQDEAQASLNQQSATLLHLIYHSQIRDGLLHLGRFDWRHLLDARDILKHAAQTSSGGKNNLVRNVLKIAGEFDLTSVAGCFFHQLNTFYPVDEARSCIEQAEVQRTIKRFERAQSSRLNYWLAETAHYTSTRVRLYVKPSTWTYFFGPGNFRQIALKVFRFLIAHLLSESRP